MKKKHLFKATILASFMIAFTGITSVFPALAATADNEKATIGISPVNKKYKLDAGKSKSDMVKVTNAGQSAFTFKVYAEPYSVKSGSYEPDYLTQKKNTDLESWVTFGKDRYTLEPNSSIDIPYTINVPAEATPGGHYGVIFAETQPSDLKAGDAAALQQKQRVGTVLYATVNGEFTIGGKFNGIRTPGLQFKSPLRSELDVENTGNSDFEVETVYAVSDIFGNRKFTGTNTYQMLPQSDRKIVFTWDKSPNFGLYEVTLSAKFLDQKTTKTSYVLMAPLLYYMIFVVGLLVIVIFFVQRRR